MCIFSEEAYNTVVSISTWCVVTDGRTIALANPNLITPDITSHIQACYNPIILRRFTHPERIQLTLTAIKFVCAYHGIIMEKVEIHDLSYCISYMPEKSDLPTTSRRGIRFRTLSWIDTLQATSYTSMPFLQSSVSYPTTSTSAMSTSNFDEFCDRTD